MSADVEVRKKAEESLRRAQIDLERKVAERTQELELANAAKSRFLAMASHDLRQPLHALGLFVAQLRTPLNRGKGQRRSSGSMQRAKKWMKCSIRSWIFQARCWDPYTQNYRIPDRAPVAKLRRGLIRQREKKACVYAFRRSDAWVRSDAMLLERILLNLVSNAVRYTLRGGIIVGCRRRGERAY